MGILVFSKENKSILHQFMYEIGTFEKNSNIKLSSVLTCDFSSQKYLDSVFKPDFFLEKVRRKTVVTLPLFIDNKTYSPLIFKIQSKRRQKDINFWWLFHVFLGFWAQKPKNARKSHWKLMPFWCLFNVFWIEFWRWGG